MVTRKEREEQGKKKTEGCRKTARDKECENRQKVPEKKMASERKEEEREDKSRENYENISKGKMVKI